MAQLTWPPPGHKELGPSAAPGLLLPLASIAALVLSAVSPWDLLGFSEPWL